MALKDKRARSMIGTRIDRLSFGNAGDVKPVGDGISELRIHYGPGYRVYFTRRSNVIFIMLCGGTKKRQSKDIELAKELAKSLKA